MRLLIRSTTVALTILFLVGGLTPNVCSQTPSFDFLHGSSDEILSADFDRDSFQLFTLDKAGFLITWDVNNMYPIRKFYAVPSYVFETSRSPYHVDRKMVKVTKNRIWVYDASNGLPTEILDSYDRISGKFIPTDVTEQRQFKNEFADEISLLYPQKLDDIGKGKKSFANNKFEYSSDEIIILNSEGVRIKRLDKLGDLHLFGISSVFPLSEDVLLIAGNYMPTRDDLYSTGDIGTRSALIKFNWKTGIGSSNRSYDREFSKLSRAKLETAGDSIVILKNEMNFWGYQIKPSQLINNFYSNTINFGDSRRNSTEKYLTLKGFEPKYESFKLEEGQSNLINFLTDSYPSGSIYKIMPLTNTDMALIAQEVNGSFGEILRYKHVKGFIPIKFHSKQELILWQGPFPNASSTFLVSDFKGKELKRFAIDIPGTDQLNFSPDGNWFTLMKNSSEIELYNTKRFDKPINLKTGVEPTTYLSNKIQFNEISNKLAYNIYDPVNQNRFIIATYDLSSEKRDTLFKIDATPNAWSLDKNFRQVAISYPVNFADTSVFNNKDRSALAIKNKFRNIYNPTIFIMDVLADSVKRIIQVGKQNPVRSMAFLGNKLVSMQQDGLLHYYDVNSPKNRIMQWVYGKDQAIISDGSYFATSGLIDFILVETKGNYYPVAEQDILFNAPHKIIAKIDSSNTDIYNLYRLAHEKRIKQFNGIQSNSIQKGIPVIGLPTANWNDYTLKDSVLNLALEIKDPASVEKLLVRVNGFSVFGKQGYSLNGASKNITLKIPLDSGYNEVRIQAVDKLNSYSLPINLEYEAKYVQPRSTPKLWVLSAGVSKYADSLQNLSYAAKDAGDFVKVFAYKKGYDIKILTITDTLVNAETIVNTLKNSKLKKDDVMLVYLAGHGLLDANGDFYFAGHDMDFQNPSKKGLSYSNLMDVLEAVPARRKVLFMDACNSGFVDKSVYNGGRITTSTGDHMTLKNTRGSVVINKPTSKIPDKDIFLFMQKTFSDLSQDNNISILSAALGNSYALETNELKNGLFTYSVIKGLGLAKASVYDISTERKYGENSTISISDLANYLEREVKLISKGAQTPSFSLSKNASWIIFNEAFINVEMEMGSYKTLENPKQLSKGEAYKLFLDRYKE